MGTSRQTDLENEVFTVDSDKFNALAAKIFSFQCQHVPVLGRWTENFHSPGSEISFLPIRFFKENEVLAGGLTPDITFTSSSTTGTGISGHSIAFTDLYVRSFSNAFARFYDPPEDYCILALLPSYLERGGSSLVFMADHFIRKGAEGSGFFLDDTDRLLKQLANNEAKGQKTLLLGVTYALLDLASAYKGPALRHTTIMETGGMKGKRKEMVREEVHGLLQASFGVPEIHSEYGMTELLSQAYSHGKGIFHCPPWMQVSMQDINDPGTFLPAGKTGRICITDLANLYSCSFIATDDIGRLFPDGSFEVLGRLDFSDTRGCNLMVG